MIKKLNEKVITLVKVVWSGAAGEYIQLGIVRVRHNLYS
jgi:hypothetical protein